MMVGMDLAEVIVLAQFAKSKTQARKLIQQRAIRLNDVVVSDSFARLFFHETTGWILIQWQRF
jgi:hypothetical protein